MHRLWQPSTSTGSPPAAAAFTEVSDRTINLPGFTIRDVQFWMERYACYRNLESSNSGMLGGGIIHTPPVESEVQFEIRSSLPTDIVFWKIGSPPSFYQPVTPSGAGPPANPNQNFGAPRRGGGGGPSRLLPRSASLSPSGTSIPETRRNAMVSIEVDGESISPEDITEEAGWLTSHRRRGARALAQLGLTPGHSHGQEGAGSRPTNRQSRAEKQTSRQPRLPRQPPLPKEDIKIVLRPREGLDITKMSHAELRDGVLRATGLGYDEAAEDLLRINPAKNINVASTPSMEHANKYTAVKELRFGEKSYNVTAYAAPPEDTVKGIIHNIPEYDSAEDITRSLIYKKNTTILQARRMGRTNSAIIVFEGTKVPYYVYYRGAEYRCFIHKKRHEVCDGCGRLGHRTDVCPAPDKKICKICGTEAPPENHQCEPKCALCARDHPTGDKKCRLRFQTPYLLKKRKWEKQQSQNNRRRPQNGSSNPASTSSMLKKGEPSGDTPGQRGRSGSFPRLPQHGRQSRRDVSSGPGTRDNSASSQHRLRSSSRRRSPSIQGRQNQRHKSRSPSRNGRQLTGGNQTNKVSWANTVSHGKTSHKRSAPPKGGPSSEQSDQQSEITKIKQMLELVISENKKT
ncbi:hypothetical protein HPB47_019156 [Ixodes persulcatus]|uniref:Uncharacterized protein n=1 Tax=Ixodes persulcatus TaxID=34615 RepID=A0AC60QKT3_IXOPE|nr:hypothetical protein HPB47_019156 [Ixodes persulcatus]